MGIDDEVARLHGADAVEFQNRLRYKAEAKATFPAYKNAFLEFYQSLIKHEVPPLSIVEMAETIPGQRYKATVVGEGWQYAGVVILPDGTFAYAPANRDSDPGWKGRWEAQKRALEEIGITGDAIRIPLGHSLVEVNWAKSITPQDRVWQPGSQVLAVHGIGGSWGMQRSPSGSLSEPGLLYSDSDGDRLTPFTTVFAELIYKAKQPPPPPPRPEPKPFVPPPIRGAVYDDKPPGYAREWRRPEPAKATGGAWKKVKGAAAGLFVGLLIGAFIGFALSVPISMNGGGMAAPITALAITVVGGVLGLLLGLDR